MFPKVRQHKLFAIIFLIVSCFIVNSKIFFNKIYQAPFRTFKIWKSFLNMKTFSWSLSLLIKINKKFETFWQINKIHWLNNSNQIECFCFPWITYSNFFHDYILWSKNWHCLSFIPKTIHAQIVSFFLCVEPIFFLGYEFCVFFVQIFSATFTFHFNIISKFYIFDYFVIHFPIYKQLKIKNKNPNPNDQINTPIKFKHARIIHLSWSVVEFRNVVFVFGNQTIFFILLAVYYLKSILLILRTFSMHIFLSWMYILNKAKQILHRPTLRPYKFNCLHDKWLRIILHWLWFFPFCLRLVIKSNPSFILLSSLYIYFLQFQVNFYFFIWQIQFLLYVYFLNDRHSKFCLDPERQVVFQDIFVLDSRRNFGVDRLIGHCLFCLAWVGKVILHRLGSLNLDENWLHL